MTKDLGDWIQTASGKVFYPLNPFECLDAICIEDIAWPLSQMCRYNGATKRFYSVAEHSIIMARYVSKENAFSALMHDASEAYLGDIVRPLKRYLPEYGRIEEQVQAAIAKKFNFQNPPPNEVKLADRAICNDERKALLSDCPKQWGGR